MPKGKGQGSIVTQFKKGEHRSPETEFEKGAIPWNIGQPWTPEIKEKIRRSKLGKPVPSIRRRIILVCERCGKEFEVTPAHKRPYCSQQCARLRGRNKLIRAGGYLYVWRDGKYIAEQRVVMEQVLGRSLKKTEVVHHNNGDKLDNREANLTVMSQACHRALVDYLASLWIKEHLNEVDKITRDFTQTFSSGG